MLSNLFSPFRRSAPNAAAVDASAVWLDRAVMLAVIVGGVIGISPPVADPDLWGHVQYGRDMFRHGLAETCSYSYTAEGQPWINHEIVAEGLLALGADWLGPQGMLITKMALGMGLLLVVMRHAKSRGAGALTMAIMALVTAPNLAMSWAMRPQLISMLSFVAELWLLAYVFEGWEGSWKLAWFGRPKQESPEGEAPAPPQDLGYDPRRWKWLWLMVPLMVLWTNSHGGFLAGLAVLVAYLGLRSIEAISVRGVKAWPLVARFAMIVTATVCATVINPYGIEYHIWLFDDLRVPRPEIVEWLPTNWFESSSYPLWVALALAIATVVWSPKRWDLTHAVILTLLLWQTCSHRRHGAFWAIALGFWAAPHVEGMIRRARAAMGGNDPPEGVPLAAGLHPRTRRHMAFALALTAPLLIYSMCDRLKGLVVSHDYYPVRAMEYIAARGFHGRALCAFNWAQYFLYVFGPGASGGQTDETGLRIDVDGRCRTSYSQAMLDRHGDFILGNEPPEKRYREPGHVFDGAAALRVGSPDIVLLDRGQPHSQKTMEARSDEWTLLYQDQLAQVWGRCDKYDDPNSAEYVKPTDRTISEEPQKGWTAWPALPPSLRRGSTVESR